MASPGAARACDFAGAQLLATALVPGGGGEANWTAPAAAGAQFGFACGLPFHCKRLNMTLANVTVALPAPAAATPSDPSLVVPAAAGGASAGAAVILLVGGSHPAAALQPAPRALSRRGERNGCRFGGGQRWQEW